MGRRTPFLLLTAAALLLAAAAWGSLALVRQLRAGQERAVAVRGVLADELRLSGVVLRSESVLTTDRAGVRLLAADGVRVPAGQPLAIVYDSGAAYFRAALLLRLRSERSLADGIGIDPEDYFAALARRDMEALPLAARGLGQALGQEGPLPEALEEQIAALAPYGEESILAADRAGFFSAETDGWEGLSAQSLTPSALRARLSAPEEPAEGLGRLVTGSEWSFCALVQEPAAARFSPGQRLRLRLPEGAEVAARVGSVVTQGHDTLVTFRCREHLENVLDLRRTELHAVFSRYEGLLLPAAALREEDGACYVLRADLPLGGRTPVTLLFRQGESAVVRSDSLREGMSVIVG